MAELLLLNPRRRRRRSGAKKTRRARRRNPIAAVASKVRRRRNPIAAVSRRRARRRNPISLRRASRRRRNPIGGGLSVSNLSRMLKDAAIMGAGAIGVDMLYSKLNGVLPSTMQPEPNKLGVGDAVKAVLTAALGAVLNRPTKGLAGKAAMGSLVVQARDIAMKAMTQAGMPTAGMGYYTPGAVLPYSARVGPNRTINRNGAGASGVSAFMRPGATALLNGAGQRVGAYVQPGFTPMLNAVGRRSMPASMREGVKWR